MAGFLFCFAVPKIELRGLHMPARFSTNELHPSPIFSIFLGFI